MINIFLKIYFSLLGFRERDTKIAMYHIKKNQRLLHTNSTNVDIPLVYRLW